jgi:hypothetical protein
MGSTPVIEINHAESAPYALFVPQSTMFAGFAAVSTSKRALQAPFCTSKALQNDSHKSAHFVN